MKRCAFAVAALLASAAAAATPSFQGSGDLPGGTSHGVAEDASGDGVPQYLSFTLSDTAMYDGAYLFGWTDEPEGHYALIAEDAQRELWGVIERDADAWLGLVRDVDDYRSDLTFDGTLNAASFEVGATHFGGAMNGGSWTALPEPSSLSLLAVAAGAILRRRRRC